MEVRSFRGALFFVKLPIDFLPDTNDILSENLWLSQIILILLHRFNGVLK